MNIFVIPTWYPTSKIPIGGIFVKEQSMAVAEFSPEDNVIVAKWDDGNTHLTPRKPLQALGLLASYRNKNSIDEQITNNFFEFYTPTLSWSKKIPFGGVDRLYRAIKSSFLRARSKFVHIDIIHAHVSYLGGYLAYLLSKEFNIPYVLTEHMGPFPFDSLLKNGKPIKEIDIAFKNAKRTIAVSTSLQKRIQSFNLPCSDVVPNLIDDERFVPSSKKADQFTFFTLCGISAQKGIDTLLKAISNLDNDLKSKIDFKIGGAGAELQKYKQMSKDFELANVHWLGEVSRTDAPNLFQSSHAYIMLSRHETFGIVYAEAIACGLPVIATKCGGPEDIVNNINGLLIGIDDIEEASRAITNLYNNYSYYDSSQIRMDFENRFSKKLFVSKLKNIYQEAIKCAGSFCVCIDL